MRKGSGLPLFNRYMTRKGYCFFLERTKFLRTNKIFRKKFLKKNYRFLMKERFLNFFNDSFLLNERFYETNDITERLFCEKTNEIERK